MQKLARLTDTNLIFVDADVTDVKIWAFLFADSFLVLRFVQVNKFVAEAPSDEQA